LYDINFSGIQANPAQNKSWSFQFFLVLKWDFYINNNGLFYHYQLLWFPLFFI